MLGKTSRRPGKDERDGAYTRENKATFEYLLRTADLNIGAIRNLPVIIIVLRLSDHSMYWKDVSAGGW